MTTPMQAAWWAAMMGTGVTGGAGMLAGIRNVGFTGLTADVEAGVYPTRLLAEAMSVSITPSSSDAVVGVLFSGTVAAENTALTLARATGGTNVFLLGEHGAGENAPELARVPDSELWFRQLFLDKPNATTAQTYKVYLAGELEIGTTLSVFELSSRVKADVLYNTIMPSSTTWSDVASVTVAPTHSGGWVRLQFVAWSRLPNINLRLLRGSDVLVSAPSHDYQGLSPQYIPSNFEDWFDNPTGAGEQTYTLQFRSGFPNEDTAVRSGSFLLAEPIPA